MTYSGERNPNWKGGRYEGSGYIRIKLPSHPRANIRGYVLEHIVVAEHKIGRPLKPGEEIHHINGNGTDNRPDNLMVCKDRAEHTLIHKPPRQCKLCGAPHKAKGLCKRCWYNEWKRNGGAHYWKCSKCGKPLANNPITGLCFVCYTNKPACPLCGEKHFAKGLCHRHWYQWRYRIRKGKLLSVKDFIHSISTPTQRKVLRRAG